MVLRAPGTALVLADCYAEFGELLQASVMYSVVAEDQPDLTLVFDLPIEQIFDDTAE